MVWRCLPYLLLSGLAAAAHCEGRPLPVAAPNGTTTAESHGSHGHHDLALESMLPISCALILAFVLSSSMESFQISFFPVGDGTWWDYGEVPFFQFYGRWVNWGVQCRTWCEEWIANVLRCCVRRNTWQLQVAMRGLTKSLSIWVCPKDANRPCHSKEVGWLRYLSCQTCLSWPKMGSDWISQYWQSSPQDFWYPNLERIWSTFGMINIFNPPTFRRLVKDVFHFGFTVQNHV